MWQPPLPGFVPVHPYLNAGTERQCMDMHCSFQCRQPPAVGKRRRHLCCTWLHHTRKRKMSRRICARSLRGAEGSAPPCTPGHASAILGCTWLYMALHGEPWRQHASPRYTWLHGRGWAGHGGAMRGYAWLGKLPQSQERADMHMHAQAHNRPGRHRQATRRGIAEPKAAHGNPHYMGLP